MPAASSWSQSMPAVMGMACLTALPVRLADQPPVLTRAHPDTQPVAVVDLDAVGTHVHEAAHRVAHDDHVARADVAPAVLLVVARHRKLPEVHVAARLDVLQH